MKLGDVSHRLRLAVAGGGLSPGECELLAGRIDVQLVENARGDGRPPQMNTEPAMHEWKEWKAQQSGGDDGVTSCGHAIACGQCMDRAEARGYARGLADAERGVVSARSLTQEYARGLSDAAENARAENARLRAALVRIYDYSSAETYVRDIAARALGEGKP